MSDASLDSFLPNLRWHFDGFLSGTVNLVQFLHWTRLKRLAIALHGSDEDVQLLNVIDIRPAEYPSDYLNVSDLLDALRTDLLVQHELASRLAAVAQRATIEPQGHH